MGLHEEKILATGKGKRRVEWGMEGMGKNGNHSIGPS